MKKIVIGLALICVAYSSYHYFSIDRSAVHRAEAIHRNNIAYMIMAGSPPFDSNTLSFVGVDDADYTLYQVGDDENINYLYASSFLDNFLFKNKNYNPPTSGEITAVYVNWNRIKKNQNAVALASELANQKKSMHECIFDSRNDLVKLSTSYDKSYVAAKNIGYIGFYGEKWVFVQDINNEKAKSLYLKKKTRIPCSIIEEGVKYIKSIPSISHLAGTDIAGSK